MYVENTSNTLSDSESAGLRVAAASCNRVPGQVRANMFMTAARGKDARLPGGLRAHFNRLHCLGP